MEKVLFS